MGAFATRLHFDELADFLASEGCAVLSYDHRGIGKSTCIKPSETQTSVMLANDCVALCDHVFGQAASVHVYGASMGGCIAQHVALTFLSLSRLKSLYLAVTTRGNYFTLPLPQWIWKFLVQNLIVKSNSQEMIKDLVPKCFYAAYLKTKSSSGKSMRERWEEKWTKEYTDWFSFSDAQATAAQCSVFATHYLSAQQLQPLMAFRDHVTVHIAEKDDLMPPSKQRELGHLLQAKLIVFAGGHMGNEADKDLFFQRRIGVNDNWTIHIVIVQELVSSGFYIFYLGTNTYMFA